MKIAFLNLYTGVNKRGAESFSDGLATKLAENHHVTFFMGGHPTGKEKYKVVQLESFIAQPSDSFKGGLLQKMAKRVFLDRSNLAVLLFSIKAFPYLWKGKFQVMRPINGFWQVVICKIIKFFRGGKIIIRGASGPGWDERWNLYLKPDLFVATTPETAAWAKRTCPWTTVEMLPLAVDVEKFSHAKSCKLDLEHPFVLCNAAADSYKRVDFAIKAVAKLPKGSLIHLGEGPQKQEIIKLGSELLGKKRFLSTSVPYDEVPQYYKAADVVVFPSKQQESFGMVLLEAMAAGKMVVATDTSKTRWILGPAGIFVDPENIEEFSKGIEKALKVKADSKEIQNHFEKFTWDTVANEYENLFEKYFNLPTILLGLLLVDI